MNLSDLFSYSLALVRVEDTSSRILHYSQSEEVLALDHQGREHVEFRLNLLDQDIKDQRSLTNHGKDKVPFSLDRPWSRKDCG